ncbi:MAG: choice-of-anchor L domain-containing protein [Flavobacteriales bacterium]|nr:choice-of-anchor L domain-containing protein [Flavobacteriales bacterium]MBK9075925.1 choice-of-anchor L domain-containing protein [Flavobacteriales bacterium]MBK9537309.1 choice-of-anchor L domain-containing protein [Flavobacteriales bacterium]
MKRSLRSVVLPLLLMGLAGQCQLVTNGSISPQDLVQNVLLGPGVTISNVQFNGAPGNQIQEQMGYFNGSDCVLGIDSGLVMCTGGISVAVGPNNDGGAQMEVLGNFTSDEDLDNVADDMCMDVAILEFDFVPQGDSISFAYSFASEEYLEWVNAGYNDAFGFFLSGPGIFGPFQNDAINLAVVPGTFSYVSVNTINDFTNQNYYQDNGDGFATPYSNDPYYFQFDGFTRGLRAEAAVQCGQTYHIKMAIGDVGDPNWDSGVFITGGSFTSTGGVGVSFTTSSGSDSVTEGCDSAWVTITRSTSAGDLVLPLTTSGTASSGTDVTGLPTSVTIPDGQNAVTIGLGITGDQEAEDTEDLVVCVVLQGSCSGDTACAVLQIVDAEPLLVSAEDVISECSGSSLTLQATVTGGSGPLEYVWSTGSTMPTISVLDEAALYEVTITDACGNTGSVAIAVIAPCGIIVPNVFSPNGDGANDRFEITGIEHLTNTVRIFNRWGQIVYEASDYRNSWDGQDVSDGTYFYEVVADGLVEPLTGHLTILHNTH